jgi:hypothetical protein
VVGRRLVVETCPGEVDAAVLRDEEAAVARPDRRVRAAADVGDAADRARREIDPLDRARGDGGADERRGRAGLRGAPHRALPELDAGGDDLGRALGHGRAPYPRGPSAGPAVPASAAVG